MPSTFPLEEGRWMVPRTLRWREDIPCFRLDVWLLQALTRAVGRMCGDRSAFFATAHEGIGADAECSSQPSDGAFSDTSEPEQSAAVSAIDDRSTPTGWAAAGPFLDSRVRDKVELARQQPAEFASLRNRRQASSYELDRSPLPDVREMARLLAKEAQAVNGQCAGRLQWDGTGDWRELVQGAPTCRVTLAMLIGEQALREWLGYVEDTQRAFDAVRRGELAKTPGDFVIRNSVLPEWARGFVWDTECPVDCVPVRRSDRHTLFHGERQLNRARFREIARKLAWEEVDPDIIEQTGDGGSGAANDGSVAYDRIVASSGSS